MDQAQQKSPTNVSHERTGQRGKKYESGYELFLYM